MRHPAGILDTSTVILLPRLADPASLPSMGLVTTVTLAELALGPLLATSDRERAARAAELHRAEQDFEVLPFDLDAARAFGHVAASYRSRGRKVAARTFDALIAASALSRHLPLYTANPDDFEGVDGLDVVAVPHPGAP